MSRMNAIIGMLAGAGMALSGSVGALEFAQAAAPPLTHGTPARGDASAVYTVPLYKSTIVPLRRIAQRVSVGNPGVADILVIRKDELYVVGKALGSTNVVVWGDDGRVFTSFDVEVTHDLDTLRAKLYQLLPGENIQVHSAQEQLILSGQVSSAARMDAAREVASGFLPDCIVASSDAPVKAVSGAQASRARGADASCKKGTVVNLMQVGGANQVMLKVTVAEVASSVVKKLDSNLNLLKFGARDGRLSGGAIGGGASFPNAEAVGSGALFPIFDGPGHPIGPPQQFFQPSNPVVDGTGAFLSYLEGNLFVQAVLDISRRNGLAKILSEPTLTTLTGQEAKFLSGGEFPVPVPQGGASNSVTVEFKEFGVGLRFLPTVLDSGRINLDLGVTVSELSSDNTVVVSGAGTSSVFQIPSLTKRSAESVIELADGQTIGIAGLINDNVREFVDKFPGLGDLPIIGMLFRSQQFLSGQSELVIFVTPHLARPISADQVRLPTDTFVPASDFNFYILGQMSQIKARARQGRAAGAEADADPAPQPAPAARPEELPQGSFGHQVGE